MKNAARILVVDDDPFIQITLSRGLADLEGAETKVAGTLASARRLWSWHPDLLICDLQLPDGVGVELLSDMDAVGRRIPTIFISGYLTELFRHIPHRPDIQTRAKPFAMEDILASVNDQLALSVPAPAPFTLGDYLQLASLAGYDLRITLSCRNCPEGVVLVRDGEPWHAEDRRGTGDRALQRLFIRSQNEPDWSAFAQTLHASTPERTVLSSASALILDAARSWDEGRTHDLDIDRPKEPTQTGKFEDMVEAGVAALLRKNYADAWDNFSAAARLNPTHPTVQANLKRLSSLGYAKERS